MWLHCSRQVMSRGEAVGPALEMRDVRCHEIYASQAPLRELLQDLQTQSGGCKSRCEPVSVRCSNRTTNSGSLG